MPPKLEGLAEIALDLRWSWSHKADELWERVAPEIWNVTRNPWLILQMVTRNRLDELAADADFCKFMDDVVKIHRAANEKIVWFKRNHPDSSLSIAYFSMEYGLSESLPIYSGGLGILAGDYLKTASDLGVPLIGIGLLYQQGYFRQAVDTQGHQIEFYPYNNPYQLPVVPVRDQNDEWLRIMIKFPGRRLWLRVWEAQVGRLKLYLLDSNDPMNSPADRGITSELYGGGPELRLQHEIVLGIGGWRTLHDLGIEPEVCHLNEGHAALAVIERARSFRESSGQSFDIALAATRAGNIFTTHTPVEAGFDRFAPEMISRYLGDYADEAGIGLTNLLTMGRQDPVNRQEHFNMAYLAVRGSATVNGVSRLHGEVSRRIFQPLFPRWPQIEVPVTSVTNGIHVPSWDSSAADKLWCDNCGKERWVCSMDTITHDFNKGVSDKDIWDFRMAKSKHLIHFAQDRQSRQLVSLGASVQEIKQSRQPLDPGTLIIGFARRFASYKRPNLLLHDQEHLARILGNAARPVQLIIAGKAHPRDEGGKAMIREWAEFIRRPDIRSHVIFLTDYDMTIAEHLVQGIDLWINTPRRPWEACGTSGMKVLVNGGLNLSERDGWWAEAYRPEVGWAIGDGQEHGDDPAWDTREAEQLYQLLEQEIIPCFYNRDENGIPLDWVARMRTSMTELTTQFSSNRMIREYINSLYLPASRNYQKRTADGAKESASLCQWRESLETNWQKLRFGRLNVQRKGEDYTFTITVHLYDLDPGAVQVQLYAEPGGNKGPEIHVMAATKDRETANSYIYQALIPALRPAEHYTPRIIPYLDGVRVPLEARHILWYEP